MLRLFLIAFAPCLAQPDAGCAKKDEWGGGVADTKKFDGLWTEDMRPEKEDEAPVDIIIIAVVLGFLGVCTGVASHFKGQTAEHAMENSFYNLGMKCGTHPRKFIAVSIFLLFVFSFGATLREDELDPATLWVPKGAVALDHSAM